MLSLSYKKQVLLQDLVVGLTVFNYVYTIIIKSYLLNPHSLSVVNSYDDLR